MLKDHQLTIIDYLAQSPSIPTGEWKGQQLETLSVHC